MVQPRFTSIDVMSAISGYPSYWSLSDDISMSAPAQPNCKKWFFMYHSEPLILDLPRTRILRAGPFTDIQAGTTAVD